MKSMRAREKREKVCVCVGGGGRYSDMQTWTERLRETEIMEKGERGLWSKKMVIALLRI